AKDRAAVERLRDALLGGTDEWSIRFQHAAPERDRLEYDRTNGELSEVRRSATLDADDLQKFFFDLPVTVKVVRGEGWAELGIYPGTSDRATRAQRDAFESKLNEGAGAARRYINSLRVLYEYLDEHPQRARDVFDALFRDDDDPRLIVGTKTEVELVTAARSAMQKVLDVDWSGEVSRDADLTSNPFPAELVVRTPSEPILVEGFTREERNLVIRPKTLLEAVAALNGRWVSPEPIALALSHPEMKTEEMVDFFANSPRHAEPVVGMNEVLSSLREQLKPKDRYRVRFITKASAP
ncbi:MAG TPA: hypothetical protein VG323_22005, partial [Thermoanaerobaculia bacterium]|nr:hypothetical protein [Thermoanaerobaculia bacterium]